MIENGRAAIVKPIFMNAFPLSPSHATNHPDHEFRAMMRPATPAKAKPTMTAMT